MNRMALLLSSLAGGLSLPVFALSAPGYRRLEGNDRDRLRGDWVRVGQVMRGVIDRQTHERRDEKTRAR